MMQDTSSGHFPHVRLCPNLVVVVVIVIVGLWWWWWWWWWCCCCTVVAVFVVVVVVEVRTECLVDVCTHINKVT